MRKTFWTITTCAALLLAASTLTPAPASACGGLFCSQSNPVNQAAERIIFAHNGDGTVTAVVQIMYEGPSEQFAWVLPVPGVPSVGVSSDLAFDRLQQASNPQYQLQTQMEDDCNRNRSGSVSTSADGSESFNGSNGATAGGGGVQVLASGAIGPYDYTVISAMSDGGDVAQEALDWLTENGYDITATAPDMIRPYLEDGMNLLAFRLTKGNSSGSIRPVTLTYETERPMIPIKPTAMAANDDMGVMVWVLSQNRAVPINYRSLVLNDALINWFNPSGNYNDVINVAANEAGGQGFVTELAGPSTQFQDSLFAPWEADAWTQISSRTYTPQNHIDLIQEAAWNFSAWDGFTEAALMALPELATADPAEIPNCLQNLTVTDIDPETRAQRFFSCNAGVFSLEEFSPQLFIDLLEDNAIEPMRDTQALFDRLPYTTRLYTTLSAAEMTLDPVFDFNPDLPELPSLHIADQFISCDPINSGYAWRIRFPDGTQLYGQEQGTWPFAADSLPANRQILQASTSGESEVIEDNTSVIASALEATSPGSNDGCACSTPSVPASAPSGALLLIAGAALFFRRRK